MNLLIVDDEYYTVESLRMKIEEKRPGFERVFCAYNLKHALEYFAQYEIGVMVCDIEMPGGERTEFAGGNSKNGAAYILYFSDGVCQV